MKRDNYLKISAADKHYPILLREISDPPQLIYVKGGFEKRDENSVAIVGARLATSEGLRTAYDLAFQLAGIGITVVSGLAQGIDTEVHKGALDAGGRTIAVLGTGIDIIYPESNIDLAGKILAENHGALISEFAPGTPALPYNFPQRNRIISGLSRGTVVVEAREKSGALITARFALEQNREVFAVPGPISRATSVGPNRLIRDGAKIVTTIDDIIGELGIKLATSDKRQATRRIEPKFDNLDENELKIASIVSLEPKTAEDIIRESELSAPQVNASISILEIEGIIRKSGGAYTLNN